MTIKNPNTFNQWVFFMETPQSEQFSIQEYTLQKLVDLAIRQIAQFDSLSPGYSAKARAEAQSLGLDWRQYMSYAIQHQICLRLGGLKSGLCWGGTGDKIHEFMKGLDSQIEESSFLIRKTGEILTKAATFVATGSAQTKFGGCATCGGRRTFSGQSSNLGRASRLK